MSSLSDLLNPVEVRRKSVKLLLNNCSVDSDSPSSPESPTSDNTALDYAAEDASEHLDHEPHPDCPDSLDCLPDTDGRPQHTLPVILRCAILGSPRKRLTIREIYAAMEAKYAYYRTAGPTWKQSVRHHLSLNRLFERQPRPVTDPGFGSYWTVNLSAPPGTKRPRKRGRPTKHPKITPDTETCASNTSIARHQGQLSKDVPSTSTNVKWNLEGHELLSFDEECRASRDEDMCDSDDEPMHPFDRRSSLIGLTPYPGTVSSVRTQPYSDDSSSTIDKLESELAVLRRQASDAVSLSIRLSDQLALAHAESSRVKSALRSVEVLLEEESYKRMEAEKIADEEIKLRQEAEDALLAMERRWSRVDRRS